MQANESNTRGGIGRVWLFSSGFWLVIALVSSALVQMQPTPGGLFTWRPFYTFAALWTFLPYVPGSVWMWRVAARLVDGGGGRRWLHAGAAIVAMAAVCVVCTVSRVERVLWFPLASGMFLWCALEFSGLLGVCAAIQASRAASARKRALLSAQLRALRAQLQPHFLFNTLHAIGVTAKTDGTTAARMTTLLGDLLRQTLRERDGELVSLAEERELLQPYLQLQQLRFGDRLRVELDLPDDVLAAAVPDLILQPLVENALRHGIEQLPGSGHVIVRARRVADALELQVADDGVGPATAARDGIGLGGTRARLQAIYGDAADVQLAPGGVRGTVATVRLPFREVAHAA